MATTTNGIYYPNDYESVADIPEDMKKMAESVDTKIAENKTEIDNIKTEQTTQNTNISNLQKDNTTNKQDITEIKAKDTDQDKYIAELEAENSRLREDLNGLPKGQASGESIDLTDSAEMRCELKISGNSKQETREGYNKFKTTTTSRTVNGVTITKNNDSSISFSGTTTADFTVQLVNYNNLEITQKMYLRNYGTLENANFIVQLIRSGKTSVEYVPIRPDVTLNAGDIIQKIYVQQLITGKAVSGTLDILLTDYENKDKGYEQYGASPSPDYPSENESCGDNINIFDINVASTWQGNSTTYSVKNNMLNVKGYYFISIEVPVKKNTDYYLSAIREIVISKDYSGAIAVYSTDKNTEIHSRDSGNFTFNSGNNNSVYVLFYAGLNQNGECNFSNIKIEKGSIATPYSLYGQGCINEVICNKNIFQIGNLTAKNGLVGITVEKISENRFKFNGTSTGAGRLLGKTYKRQTGIITTMSSKLVSGSISANPRWALYKGNDSWTKLTSFDLGIKDSGSGSISDIITDTYQFGMYMSSGVTFDNAIIEFQVEHGEKVTTLIEAKNQTFSIPTQQEMLEDDYFDWENEEEVHIWNKLVLNTVNTTDFGIAGEFSGDYIGIYMRQAKIDTLNIKQGSKLLSNNLKQFEKGTNVEGMFISGTGDYTDKMICIGVKRSRLATEDIAGLNTYFSENPIEIYYQSTVKTRLPFTEEQKVVAKELNNAKTYKNVTHIYSTDNISPVIDVTYKQDLETRLNNIEQAILSQGGNI